MANKKEGCVVGWFLQQFQKGVGGVHVHLVRCINDDDTAATIGGAQPEKAVQLTGFLHRDIRLEPFGAVVIATAQKEQAGLRQGEHAAGNRMIVRHIECIGRRRRIAEQAAIVILWRGQKKPRDAPGKRGLAHPTRAGDQPGMVQPAAVEGSKEFCLCRILTE